MLKRVIVGRWVARMREEKMRGGGSSKRCCGHRKVVGADGMARKYCEKNKVGRIGYAGEEKYSCVDAFLRTCLRLTVLECHLLLELATFARHVLALDSRVLVSSQALASNVFAGVDTDPSWSCAGVITGSRG